MQRIISTLFTLVSSLLAAVFMLSAVSANAADTAIATKIGGVSPGTTTGQLAPSPEDANYDPPISFTAEEILSIELVQSAHHRVQPYVSNDGFMNTYVIDSDFGVFEARGTAMLRLRIREIEALAELDELSKSEVFLDAGADSVKRAVVAPVKTVTAIATRPVETVKGIPGGVKRLFQRKQRDVEAARASVKSTAKSVGETVTGDRSEAEEESESLTQQARQGAVKLSERYLGVSKGERRWARKLGTDPYTSNQVLRDAIKEVARIDRVGNLVTRYAIPIPSVSGLDYLADINEAVWERDSYELRQMNIEKLRAMGVAEAVANAFLDSEIASPTVQTHLIAAMERLPKVAGRELLIAQAAGAEDEEQARFFLASALMMAWLPTEGVELEELIQVDPVSMARTSNAELIALLPLDYLTWNATSALSRPEWQALASEPGVDALVYIVGDASSQARDQLGKAGWRLRTGLGAQSER